METQHGKRECRGRPLDPLASAAREIAVGDAQRVRDRVHAVRVSARENASKRRIRPAKASWKDSYSS